MIIRLSVVRPKLVSKNGSAAEPRRNSIQNMIDVSRLPPSSEGHYAFTIRFCQPCNRWIGKTIESSALSIRKNSLINSLLI
jgi:hypothetical protein